MNLPISDPRLAAATEVLCRAVADTDGGRALQVGGCVRDALLGAPVLAAGLGAHGLA